MHHLRHTLLLLLACLLAVPVGTETFFRPTAHADTLSQEWHAVAMVTAPWDPQVVLGPAIQATGSQALTLAGMLHLSADQLYNLQTRHPAYLMADIQLFLHYFFSAGATEQAIFSTEAAIDNLNVLDVNTGDSTSEGALVTRICTGPLATAYLTPVTPPTATPLPPPQATPTTAVTSSSQAALYQRLRSNFAPHAQITGPVIILGYQANPYFVYSEGTWIVTPPGVGRNASADYTVRVMPTAAAARAASQQAGATLHAGCAGPGSGCSSHDPLAPLVGRPEGGWLRGGCRTSCSYTGQATVRNLILQSRVGCQGVSARTCQHYVISVLHYLALQARRY